MARLKVYNARAPSRDPTWLILSALAVVALLAILVVLGQTGVLSNRAGLAAVDEISDELQEGGTQTYTLGGIDYEVTVLLITQPASGLSEVKFLINGEVTDALAEGETDTLSTTAITVDAITFEQVQCITAPCPPIGHVSFTLAAEGSGTSTIPQYVMLASSFHEGETKTFTVNGFEYEVTLVSLGGAPGDPIEPPLAEPDSETNTYIVVGATAPTSDMIDAGDLANALFKGGAVPVDVVLLDTEAYQKLDAAALDDAIVFILNQGHALIVYGDNAGDEERDLYALGLAHLQEKQFSILTQYSSDFDRIFLLVDNMIKLFDENALFSINGALLPILGAGDHVPFLQVLQFEAHEILPHAGLVTMWIYNQRYAPDCANIEYGSIVVLGDEYVCCDGSAKQLPTCDDDYVPSMDCADRTLYCENGSLLSALKGVDP